jgi:hypothetical protein
MRRVTTLLVVGLMVLSAMAVPAAAATPQTDATQSQVATGGQGSSPITTLEQDPEDDERPDPENDTIGWERGYWANESIDVDVSDGLNQTEIERVKYRSMARLEVIRELEYEGDVPVDIISREEYANNTQGQEVSDQYRQHFNVKYEATFMVNETTDAVAVEQQNSAAGVGGFYSPSQRQIVVITENTTSPQIDEITLAQELYHALQDQYGLFENLDYSTREKHNAADGIVEGDANLADTLYNQSCEANGGPWNCLRDTSAGGGGGGLDVNLGLYQIVFQPYSDGPAWVYEVWQNQGWDAVTDIYSNPPASTEQTIHPDKYGVDEPNYPDVERTASDDWNLVPEGGQVDYASFGEAGMYVTMWYPTYEAAVGQITPQASPIIPYNNHLGGENGSLLLNSQDSLNYDHPVSAGWDGDKLLTYVPEGSSGYEETAFVWKSTWDSVEDAEEFAAAYEQLVQIHGGENVSGLDGVYTIPEGSEFADSFSVEQDGSTVTIVNAPTMSELNGVHDGAITAMDYAGEDGAVSTDELRTAISHFVTGQLDKDTFQEVVTLWAQS